MRHSAIASEMIECSYKGIPDFVCVCSFAFREAFPMVLVANKVDLVHLRKITTDQGQEMAAKHNVSSEFVSARLP